MTGLLLNEAWRTLLDIAPIVVILTVFAVGFLPAERSLILRAFVGTIYLAAGLTLFRIGLDGTLLPAASHLASGLAEQIVQNPGWTSTAAVVAFAAAIGSTAAMIEPTLAATAERVATLTGGTVRPMVLRVAVALGFGLGLTLAGLRLVYGLPLFTILGPMIAAAIVLSLLAPRSLVPLALDSGAIATSVVTVPLITAYGIGVATTLPGRDPLEHGFGLIVLAMIGASLAVLAAATISAVLQRHTFGDRSTGSESR